MPQLLNYADLSLGAMAAAAGDVPVVAGVNRAEGDRYYNSLILLDGGAVTQVYDKRHLVPFGEYIPFGALAARLGIVPLNVVAGFSKGQGSALVDLPGIGPARALICYEAIFAEEIATDTRPRLLLVISNDAWFGTGAGPRQHYQQARLRAIEQGLPVVRVANRGVSAVIDGRGQIVAPVRSLGPYGRDVALPPALAPTPYGRWGDWPLLAVLALGLITCCLRPRRM